MVNLNEAKISELQMCSFSCCLQHLRWQNHLTQQNVAELLGCSQSSVSMWERGLCVPYGQTLEKIVELYDLPHDFFSKTKFSFSEK